MTPVPTRLRSAASWTATTVLCVLLTGCGERDQPAPEPKPEPAAPAATEPAKPAAPVATAPVPAAANLTTVKLQFPSPFVHKRPFAGTVTNLESLDGAPVAAEFQAPQGTQLVSTGKPVSASAAPLQGRLAMLTDGDQSSYPDALLVFPAGGQWVQIDLGAPMAIQKVHLWHAQNLGADVYLDVVVQASDDPQFQKDVTTLYNADADGSLGHGTGADKAYVETHQGRLIDGKNTRARFVRVWGSGSFNDKRLRFAEVQVYATP